MNEKNNPCKNQNMNLDQSHHTHCQCHSHNQINQEIKSYKSAYIKEKIIFIPIILIKLLSSFFLYEKYFSYSLGKDLDIKYSQKSIFFFIIYLIILYLITIFSSAAQTNIDKYTVFSKNKNSKKELFVFKQNYLLCIFCKSAKFVRNSHCRVCNKCISFRDHHCSFVTNCLGFNNMQYFLNFCFWGAYGIIFDISSYLSFKYINLSSSVRIIFVIDFIANIFFLCTLVGIILRSIFNIYNNRTFLEMSRQIGVEIKCPIIDCLKEKNNSKLINFYNIGFLSHFFYVIGPTLLHLILPLPKLKNFILDENCPIFAKTKTPNNLQLIKYKIQNEPNFSIEKIIKDDSNVENFIKLCHTYYDGKIII